MAARFFFRDNTECANPVEMQNKRKLLSPHSTAEKHLGLSAFLPALRQEGTWVQIKLKALAGVTLQANSLWTQNCTASLGGKNQSPAKGQSSPKSRNPSAHTSAA